MNTRGVVVFFRGSGGSSEADTQRYALRSVPGKLLAGARIEPAVLDGLNADDGSDAEDVVRVGTAGNVRRGAVETEENLPVSVCSRHVLNQFAGDVARIEVWKNHH